MKSGRLLTTASPACSGVAATDRNQVRSEDRAVHDWYRFVLSFPPHLVQDYLRRFDVSALDTVLDPFCGTGTTLVECKKSGVPSVGIESNPMATFATEVKVAWSISSDRLRKYIETIAASVRKTLKQQGIDDWSGLPLFTAGGEVPCPVLDLPAPQSKLLLKNSISPLPLHKTLVLLQAIDRHGSRPEQRYGRLALANALVNRIGNLKFGPEVGVGQVKHDAPVLDSWLDVMHKIASDIEGHGRLAGVPARAIEADAREMNQVLGPESVGAVITSPPYPNEKDYTRATRLESVILGLIRNRQELRSLKQNLIRSNTRGVYRSDTDHYEVADNVEVQRIADAIERRRIELGKTSGFERMYARVARSYFGGMRRHLASLRPVLKPGAQLAYIVGDQASYLRVMIRTGQILADIAEALGYDVSGIDLFRTRPSTVTGEPLREEVVLLKWPGP
jgi:DNA modification methylase